METIRKLPMLFVYTIVSRQLTTISENRNTPIVMYIHPYGVKTRTLDTRAIIIPYMLPVLYTCSIIWSSYYVFGINYMCYHNSPMDNVHKMRITSVSGDRAFTPYIMNIPNNTYLIWTACINSVFLRLYIFI